MSIFVYRNCKIIILDLQQSSYKQTIEFPGRAICKSGQAVSFLFTVSLIFKYV